MLFAAGAAVCAAAVAVTLSGSQSGNPALDAQISAAIIAAPIAVGLFVWYRHPWRRFGKLLVAGGFALSVTTLAQSDSELPYSVGRVAGWLVEPLLVYLVLAFPSGRLTTESERRLVGAAALLVAVFYVPTLFLVDSYPSPSPWSSCENDCPGNAFMLVGSEPGFVDNVVQPFREIALMGLFAALIAFLAARIKRGSHLRRITLVPVLAVAMTHGLALIAGVVARRISQYGAPTEALAALIALTTGGIAFGFLAALSGWRLFENRALRRIAGGLASHPPALSLGETSELLSEAMDPSLEVIHRSPDEPDGWIGADGRRAKPEAGDGTRFVTPIGSDGDRVVAMVHDTALRDAPALLDLSRVSVLKALENERLGGELRSSLRELKASRARIIASADRERERIERDLHDGAQQSLVALRIRIELAGELLRADPTGAEQLLSDLGNQVDTALEQVRSLARGVYPSLLADRGLREALHNTALRNPVRTRVDADGIGRYPPEIEAAIYFCCLEAMQNAMKHAAGVELICVSLGAPGDIRFEVRDDGAGFPVDGGSSGTGLASMRDRLASVGGRLSIRTAPGAGTTVVGFIPMNGNGASPVGDRRVEADGKQMPVETPG